VIELAAPPKFDSWIAARSVQTPPPTSQMPLRPASAVSSVLLTTKVRASAGRLASDTPSANSPATSRLRARPGFGADRSPSDIGVSTSRREPEPAESRLVVAATRRSSPGVSLLPRGRARASRRLKSKNRAAAKSRVISTLRAIRQGL